MRITTMRTTATITRMGTTMTTLPRKPRRPAAAATITRTTMNMPPSTPIGTPMHTITGTPIRTIMATPMRSTTTRAMTEAGLSAHGGVAPHGGVAAHGGVAPLFCWLSPAFPVGAYAYSHGLEWAVEAGDIGDEAGLREWLHAILTDGIGRNDAILVAAAYRAARDRDRDALARANELALAFAPSSELRLETAQQGRSFLTAIRSAWDAPGLDLMADDPGEAAYPVALGLAAACHGVALGTVLDTYLAALAQNLVSAGIRLAPIGQSAGQRVVAALLPALRRVAAEAEAASLDDLGSPCFRADLGSFRHETQYTRLFRS